MGRMWGRGGPYTPGCLTPPSPARASWVLGEAVAATTARISTPPPQVLISCIIHLLALAAVISPPFSLWSPPPRPSMFQQSRATTRL